MNTVVQNIIEHMKRDAELGMSHKPTIDRVVWYIETYFLPKEKQQIVDAWDKSTAATAYDDTGEIYYNETYK
jgi:hypothetical protein